MLVVFSNDTEVVIVIVVLTLCQGIEEVETNNMAPKWAIRRPSRDSLTDRKLRAQLSKVQVYLAM